MKRVDLICVIEGLGCEPVRHGRRHDWYRNPATGVSQPVPRHREINENLARRIVKMPGHLRASGVGDPEGEEAD